jgi:hypothetical protein
MPSHHQPPHQSAPTPTTQTSHRSYKQQATFGPFTFPYYIPNPHLLSIHFLQPLPNSRQLNITRALINGANLAVPEVLFRQALTHKPHAAHPLDGLARHSARDLGGVKLGHGGVHDKVLAGFFFAGCVVDEGAGGLDFGPCLRELVLHGLEGADELAELFAVVPGVAGVELVVMYGWIEG